VSLAWLDFEREALARASVVDFGGVRVRVAEAEDLVVFKAVAWRDRD
jgi:predicted nucleotidyltransferase